MIILVFILISSPCSAQWDKTEKTMFIAHSTIRAVDMLQTNDIYHKDEYHELNPMIDWGVNQMGTKFIPIWFVGIGVVEYILLDQLSHNNRKIGLGALTALGLGVVCHNNSIGLGLNFSF